MVLGASHSHADLPWEANLAGVQSQHNRVLSRGASVKQFVISVHYLLCKFASEWSGVLIDLSRMFPLRVKQASLQVSPHLWTCATFHCPQ